MSSPLSHIAQGFEADGAPVDDKTFIRLACDPARSVIIEACAGSGKTWLLVSRMLRLLLAGAEPAELLAITFTRKAAQEMRERLLNLLHERIAKPTNDGGINSSGHVTEGISSCNETIVWLQFLESALYHCYLW